MLKMRKKFFFAVIILQGVLTNQEEFLGCYEYVPNARTTTIEGSFSPKECVQNCNMLHYRYAMIQNDDVCECANFLGVQKDSTHCKEFKHDIYDVYFTSFSVPGPPLNLKVTNITDTQLYLSWHAPEFENDVHYYKVKADFVKSYSSSKLVSLEWEFSNNTFQTVLHSLHPGTIYNITVMVVSSHGVGIAAFQTVTTQIGDPDHVPLQPKVTSRESTTMTVQLQPVENDNGPVTSYFIAIINTESPQTVEIENLKSAHEAKDEGLSYYITAEIEPHKINKVFVIGDGRYYGKYYNAPLEPEGNYEVMLGVQSKADNITKVLYSDHNEKYKHVLVDRYNNEYDSPLLVIILSVAIGIVSCLLIAGLVMFFLLRQRINNRFRQRLQDVQELTLQGPMIDVENNGYVFEEESSNVSHYINLKSQVWTIPQNLLTLHSTVLLGDGRFGHIYKGTVKKDGELLNVSIYNIADHKLNYDQKQEMLKDLDLLIKTGKHPNIVEFIGTCENVDTVSIVLEHATLNLKEFLIGSRVPTSDRFTTIIEHEAIIFGMGVAKGMAHLHDRGIVHKKLCARHVVILNGNIAKITGYGLQEFYKDGRRPNCTRWTAKEVFSNQMFHFKSDIWSFACLLWEICSLGGTPYGNTPNADIPQEITRGTLLPQLKYMYDSLYQILLNCWQVDLDERPTFNDLVESLGNLVDHYSSDYLSFRLYQGFQYEQLYLEQELEHSVF